MGFIKKVTPSQKIIKNRVPDREPKALKQKYIIEERNGKLCYMAGAKKLLILTRRPSQYWGWPKHGDSRFPEVAVLHYGRCLDIRDRIETRMLSQNTSYGAYLIFKLTAWSKGLQSVEAAVNFFHEESDRDAQERACSVFLQHRKSQWGSHAARRVDGWMEVEIGNFYVDGEDKAVEARVFEFNSWKVGLIVEGIEFRPLSTESSQFSHVSRYGVAPVPPCETDDTAENAVLSPSSSVGENEETEESEFDMSLLQELAPELNSKTQSSPLSSTITPPLKSDSQLKQNRFGRINGPNTSGSYSSEPFPASLSSDELFSGGYDCLSELEHFFNGLKRTVARKDVEADDLRQKLLKSEREAQLAIAAKESELEKLRQKVKSLKAKSQKNKETEQKLEDFDARVASAVKDYKNSGELKVEKHKFASKAFTMGFQFCVKQVLEVDPSFDISRIDVKRTEDSSSFVRI